MFMLLSWIILHHLEDVLPDTKPVNNQLEHFGKERKSDDLYNCIRVHRGVAKKAG